MAGQQNVLMFSCRTYDMVESFKKSKHRIEGIDMGMLPFVRMTKLKLLIFICPRQT